MVATAMHPAGGSSSKEIDMYIYRCIERERSTPMSSSGSHMELGSGGLSPYLSFALIGGLSALNSFKYVNINIVISTLNLI